MIIPKCNLLTHTFSLKHTFSSTLTIYWDWYWFYKGKLQWKNIKNDGTNIPSWDDTPPGVRYCAPFSLSPSFDMNRLCSQSTSRCIVSQCIWSYLCHCKSLCASTPGNIKAPQGRSSAEYQNVVSMNTFTLRSQCRQVFRKSLWIMTDMLRYSATDRRCKICSHVYDGVCRKCSGNSFHQNMLPKKLPKPNSGVLLKCLMLGLQWFWRKR